jgi:hypothetical protein
LIISARQREEFSLDLIVGFLKVVKRSASRKARSVPSFDARRNFPTRDQTSFYASVDIFIPAHGKQRPRLERSRKHMLNSLLAKSFGV